MGSPAESAERAIEPTSWLMASGRSLLRMKLGPAAAVGQVCQRKSGAATLFPSGMSDAAIRTSVFSSCATGGGGGGGSERPARNAAMPPAKRAMTSTMIRAGFIRSRPTNQAAAGVAAAFTSVADLTANSQNPSHTVRDTWSDLRISAVKRQSMVNEAYPNRVNSSWLDEDRTIAGEEDPRNAQMRSRQGRSTPGCSDFESRQRALRS